MLDTIRFRVPIDDNIAERIAKATIELSKHDNLKEFTIIRCFNRKIQLGSNNRNINIFLTSDKQCFIEFSIAKFEYGHNVYMYYPAQLEDTMDNLYQLLKGYFYGQFNHWKTWEIVRLDICYAWKFKNNDIAKLVINSLKSYKYPRQNQIIYDTSIMNIGTSYTSKFYLKNYEYYENDFPKLIGEGKPDLAHALENASQGVIRFEVSLRKKAVEYYFSDNGIKNTITIKNLHHETILECLQYFFKKSFNGFVPKYMSNQEVADKLLTEFTKNKAKAIFQYYMAITSNNPNDYNTYKKFTAIRSIRYYKQELKKIGIGLSADTETLLKEDLDFNIPSKYVTS